jgi:hypothetical protein
MIDNTFMVEPVSADVVTAESLVPLSAEAQMSLVAAARWVPGCLRVTSRQLQGWVA